MEKYVVRYTQSNDLELEVDAISKDDAKNKADEILRKLSSEDLLKKMQRGYWENWDIDKTEEA